MSNETNIEQPRSAIAVTYTLTLTEAQARALSMACDVFARLGMGKFTDALQHLPKKEGIDWFMWHDDMHTISDLLSKHMPGINGINSSIGISRADSESQVAWDLHAVIRHRLSWDRATKEGVTDGKTRNWTGGMRGVNFDEPFHYSTEPLAKMERA